MPILFLASSSAVSMAQTVNTTVNGNVVSGQPISITISVTNGNPGDTVDVTGQINNNTSGVVGTTVTGTIIIDSNGNGSVTLNPTAPAGNSGNNGTAVGIVDFGGTTGQKKKSTAVIYAAPPVSPG